MPRWAPPEGDRFFPHGLVSCSESDDDDEDDDYVDDDHHDSVDAYCWVDTPFRRRSVVSVPGTVYPAVVRRRHRDGRVVVAWSDDSVAVCPASDLAPLTPPPEPSQLVRVIPTPSRYPEHAGKIGIVASIKKKGI